MLEEFLVSKYHGMFEREGVSMETCRHSRKDPVPLFTRHQVYSHALVRKFQPRKKYRLCLWL